MKEKYSSTAFSGEGASLGGGRWNSRGVWMVYTSATQSLAALESLVHLNPPVLLKYVIFRIEFDEGLVETADPALLPHNWREEPPPRSAQAFGDAWIHQGGAVVLSVPSAIIPGETNYLLNPLHPDFAKISIGTPQPFAFDARLFH